MIHTGHKETEKKKVRVVKSNGARLSRESEKEERTKKRKNINNQLFMLRPRRVRSVS